MPYRVTWLFEGMQVNSGRTASSVVAWSETWYDSASGTIDQACAKALDRAAASFLAKRAEILHILYAVKWVRVSDVNNPRLTKTVPVNPAFAGNCASAGERADGRNKLSIGEPTTAAQVTCAVEVDFSKLPAGPGDIVHHRRFLLRGLPKSIINGNILNETGAGFDGLVNFANFMGRNAAPNVGLAGLVPFYQLRYEAHPTVDKLVTAITTVPGNPRQILLTADLGVVAQNDKILVRNAKGIQGLNRIWTVAAGAAGPPYTLGKSRFDLAGAYTVGSGTARKISYLYGPCDEYVLIGLRLKKIGAGVFGRTRGRRQVR